MHSFHDRKSFGEAHELRICAELETRNWAVNPWGQSILREEIRRAIARTRWANFPDLVAVRDGDLVAIDAKDRMSSADTGRYAVSQKCVSFGLQFIAAFGVPIFYVFGNLGVLTPQEVMAYGSRGPRGLGGSYYLINGRLAHQFDDVFGHPAVYGQKERNQDEVA